MAPAPKARASKGHVFNSLDNAIATTHEDQLIDLSEGQEGGGSYDEEFYEWRSTE